MKRGKPARCSMGEIDTSSQHSVTVRISALNVAVSEKTVAGKCTLTTCSVIDKKRKGNPTFWDSRIMETKELKGQTI